MGPACSEPSVSLISFKVLFLFKHFQFSADQVYGDQEMHASVRKLCMDYMVCVYAVILFNYLFMHYPSRKKTMTTFLSM